MAKVVVFVLIIAIIAIVVVVVLVGNRQLDPQTGCPKKPSRTQISLSIALDATDPYGPGQRREIVNKVWKTVDELNTYDRVRVYMIQQGEQIPLLDACKPGRELQHSPIERLLREESFKAKVDQALEHLQGTENNSPIIESLGWIAANHNRDGSQRRILLVSDLIEHSDVLSHYSPNWLDSYEENRVRIHNQCPNLDDVDIDILFGARPSIPTQELNLVNWWESYLSACGGTVNSIVKITGVN
ncbi:MAG: hypothetical protein OXG24_00470 [Gammaproteobacteria bacterium]|nr:hypothetical protein [Gammaproteobacteria bacterium]